MIFNYWVEMSNAFTGEVVTTSTDPVPVYPETDPVVTAAVTFPLINDAPLKVQRMYSGRNANHDVFYLPFEAPGFVLYDLYTEGDEDLSSQVVVRELFQDWEQYYPNDFRCVGAWDWTGQPIGGVGSPWFQTPLELKMAGGVIIRAGQQPRQMV